jgi:hypothetical protein
MKVIVVGLICAGAMLAGEAEKAPPPAIPVVESADAAELTRLSFVRVQAEEAVIRARDAMDSAQRALDAAQKDIQGRLAQLQVKYKLNGCYLVVDLNQPREGESKNLWVWQCQNPTK